MLQQRVSLLISCQLLHPLPATASYSEAARTIIDEYQYTILWYNSNLLFDTNQQSLNENHQYLYAENNSVLKYIEISFDVCMHTPHATNHTAARVFSLAERIRQYANPYEAGMQYGSGRVYGCHVLVVCVRLSTKRSHSTGGRSMADTFIWFRFWLDIIMLIFACWNYIFICYVIFRRNLQIEN